MYAHRGREGFSYTNTEMSYITLVTWNRFRVDTWWLLILDIDLFLSTGILHEVNNRTLMWTHDADLPVSTGRGNTVYIINAHAYCSIQLGKAIYTVDNESVRLLLHFYCVFMCSLGTCAYDADQNASVIVHIICRSCVCRSLEKLYVLWYLLNRS